MIPIRVDLYSDTITRPTAAMRAFMCAAEVGDEQKGEDPTVRLVEETVAGMLGKEAAVFLPSGTMCNEIAVKVHTQPGDEVLLDRTAHLRHFEAGGAALLSGVQLSPLDGVDGIFSAADVDAAVHVESRYAPPTTLLVVENTANLGGGRIWPVPTIEAVCEAARRRRLATHLDGARLLNAVVARGVPAAIYAAPFDSAWIDFSKGLGAPAGAVLAGSADFIRRAWRYKQAIGGAMRQAGILAAGGLYGLRHHVDRLAEDHANARHLARGLAAIPGIEIDPDRIDTNIVIFDVAATGIAMPVWLARLRAVGIRLSSIGFPTKLRAVTHLDVDRAGCDAAIAAIRAIREAG
jgi:threonine aldolase